MLPGLERRFSWTGEMAQLVKVFSAQVQWPDLDSQNPYERSDVMHICSPLQDGRKQENQLAACRWASLENTMQSQKQERHGFKLKVEGKNQLLKSCPPMSAWHTHASSLTYIHTHVHTKHIHTFTTPHTHIHHHTPYIQSFQCFIDYGT